MMHNYKLIIAYDGTGYSGWQVQPNGVTIQEILQDKIAIILRHKITLIGSGRTDSGVHARGQVAHFLTPSSLDLFRFQHSLNSMLPADIRVLVVSEVPINFHAQHHAIGKTYHYHIHLETIQNPFQRLYALHVHEKIDLPLLKHSAEKLIGTNDFTSFANEAHLGSASRDPIRTLKRLDVIDQPGGIRLEFEADGFLYKMVRNLTGTLLELASGHLKNDIQEIIEAKDRRKAGKAVAPHGLFLMHVDYGNVQP